MTWVRKILLKFIDPFAPGARSVLRETLSVLAKWAAADLVDDVGLMVEVEFTVGVHHKPKWLLESPEHPQRDSNPCRHLERVVS